MQIAANMVATIDYTLTNDAGETLDSSQDGQFCYLHGASNIIPGLEDALAGKSAGDEVTVAVEPEEGYGLRDDAMMQTVSRAMFGTDQDIEVGMQFHAESPQGETMTISVTRVEGDDITVDGNHPLAGINLNFNVKVVDIRAATQEEIQHGHAHGPHDDHHH
jgi:FKBP-type peptidyl-prolyl cis-trans isomerase SlyD